MSTGAVVTVGDQVRLTKDLMGTVRFVGEIQGRKGIYYGIELTEAKGKSNGTVGNTRYFKCKNKRGLFLRFARIQEVIANSTIHRIGINDCIELYTGNRKNIGVVRYIGIPSRCKEVYYGIQFRKPIGDNDGMFHGTRYFSTNKKCAYFVKAASSHIVKIENEQQQQQKEQEQEQEDEDNAELAEPRSERERERERERESDHDGVAKPIELDIYSEPAQQDDEEEHDEHDEQDAQHPLFTITILSNFSLKELTASICKKTQHVSSVFEIRFEPLSAAAAAATTNGFFEKKTKLILSEEQLSLLRRHSANFYELGRFFVIETLKKGIVFEDKGSYSEALKVYEAAMSKHAESTEALTYYANCLVLLDKFDEAEECYKKALDLNPFCGDICYFYSRLLEYRDKYEEARNLCNRVMNYVKKMKSSTPAPHHAIHYSCYARLSHKYVKLSLDRHNRSKLNVQHKLDRYLLEKKQLQKQMDVLLQQQRQQPHSEHIAKLAELNENIQRLEQQLMKKEAIIADKDKQLTAKQNEIQALQHKLHATDSKKKPESAAKLLSQSLVVGKETEIEKEKEMEMEMEKEKETETKKEEEHDKKEQAVINISEYEPLFSALSTKRQQSDSRRSRLLSELASSEKLKALPDCSSDEERQVLMCKKLELCAVCCDFQVESSVEMSRIENKKDLLLEVLQCMSSNKWNSIELLQQCIETIWVNLFRSLPDANMIKTDASDDEMDFRDPAWDHLQLIYELTFHVVTNTNIDKKTMKKHLQGEFLENLIHLFSSADDREPQYVKIIVHAIYGRFMALRKAIRKHLSDYCYKYVYESTLRDVTSWQGLPEILEIFCSIFQGLNVPVKPDYHVVLRNVIVPLHKSFHLDEFHEQLLQCCTQFVTKDPYSAPVILGGILKFWPKFSPLKEQLFITEIVHILNVCVRHPNIKQSDPAFATITIAVLNKFVHCMVSPHHQVAERSLMVWRDETVRICVDLHREKIWPNIYKALQHNKEKYWLSAIRNINRQIMSDFKRRDPEFFEKIEKQQQSHDHQPTQLQQQKDKKQVQREQRWIKLRQLAKPKNST